MSLQRSGTGQRVGGQCGKTDVKKGAGGSMRLGEMTMCALPNPTPHAALGFF